MMSEAIRDIKKVRQIRRKYPELEEKIYNLIKSVHSYYGLGRSNEIGTAGGEAQTRREGQLLRRG